MGWIRIRRDPEHLPGSGSGIYHFGSITLVYMHSVNTIFKFKRLLFFILLSGESLAHIYFSLYTTGTHLISQPPANYVILILFHGVLPSENLKGS